jgi:hypothetical protein
MPNELDPEEIAQRKLCARCIGETFLRQLVEELGNASTCSYCQQVAPIIGLDTLIIPVHQMFTDHFVQVSDPDDDDIEPTETDLGPGELVETIIQRTMVIDDAPAEDIRRVLDHLHGDYVDEEGPYDECTYHAQAEPDDSRFVHDWSWFEYNLKTDARFFSRDALDRLRNVFQDLELHRTNSGQGVIVEVGPSSTLTALYRARYFQSQEVLERALERPERDLGPPPFALAKAGRMNAAGISVFYGSTSPEVALAEIRPPVGSHVVVARFQMKRTVRLLDVEALSEVLVAGSLFDPNYSRRLAQQKFLKKLRQRITMPVMPDDEPFEYLITQAVADFLAIEIGLDGILYRSAQAKSGGRNITLFHKASRVAEVDLPPGTKRKFRKLFWSPEDDLSEPKFLVIEEVQDPPEPDQWPSLNMPLLWYAEPGKEDERPATLAIDLEGIDVHYVREVRFETSYDPVVRRRETRAKPIDK